MATLISPHPLWKHQREAVDFALKRTATLWHMGLGTGKSRCAITFSQEIGARRTLILCPLSVCDAWRDQFEKFAPDTEVVILNKRSVAKKREEAAAGLERARAYAKPCVIVVNYESARNMPLSGFLESIEFDLLVMDESHRIKSHNGATSKWVSKLARTCTRRVALTGTPMPHSPLDIFAQARALTLGDFEIYGKSYFRFRRKYAKMGGFGGKQVVGFQQLDDLRERMSRFTFQADRSVLDLPPAIHDRRIVHLAPKARRMYTELDTLFCTMVKEGEISASNALVKLLRLQQLTSGVASLEDIDGSKIHVRVDTAKEDAMVDIFTDLPADEPVVVFGRFRGDMDTIHRAAERSGRTSLELSGTRRELSEWQAGAAPILAVQIQAGGTGIDLTRACYVLFSSVGFSLGDYEQALARAHRPGQDRPVYYIHLVAKDTVDEKVYAALRKRKNLVEAVLEDIYNPSRR